MPVIKSKLLTKQHVKDFCADLPNGNLFGDKLHDGSNLYLIRTKTSAVWRVRTNLRIGTKRYQSWKTIGDVRDVSLAQARSKSEELHSLMRQKINVHTHQKENTNLGKTFGEIIEIYITEQKQNIKPQSRKQLKDILGKAWVLHGKVMAKITEREIKECVDRVKKKAPSTAATLLREIKAIYNFAYDEKYLVQKLDISVKAKYKMKPRSRYLSEDKLGRFFKQLWQDNDVSIVMKTAIYALFITLLRREELLSLEWDNVDFINKKIIIKSTKRISNFTIQPPMQLLEKLTTLRNICQDKKYVFRFGKKHYTGNTLCIYCKELGMKYGIGEFTPHDARRTGMNILSDNNHPYQVIDTALGHVQQGVNKSYFNTHLAEPRAKLLQDWADLIDKLMV